MQDNVVHLQNKASVCDLRDTQETQADSRKVLGRLADVYEATSDERKDTLGLMLRRNYTTHTR